MRNLFFVLIALSLVSCGGVKNSVEQNPLKVKTFTVQTDTMMQSLSFTGTVKPSDEVNLSFMVSGTLSRIYVKPGDNVSKGKLLAEIDPKDYQIQLDATQAQYDQISSEASRVIRLYKDSVTSENDYDKARFGLEQIKSKLEFAKRQVENCKLYAPYSGTIQNKYFEQNSVVASAMPILSMVSSSVPEITVDIPASVYVRKNDIISCTAHFSYDTVNSASLKIIGINAKANANQLYSVRMAITSKNITMPTPGMIAMVNLNFRRTSSGNQTSIPINALFEENNKSYIWVISDDMTVKKTIVSILNINSDGTAVINGIIPYGTQIVTAGIHKLSEGEKVEIMPAVSDTNVGGLL